MAVLAHDATPDVRVVHHGPGTQLVRSRRPLHVGVAVMRTTCARTQRTDCRPGVPLTDPLGEVEHHTSGIDRVRLAACGRRGFVVELAVNCPCHASSVACPRSVNRRDENCEDDE